MLGILLALAIQAPIATTSACKTPTQMVDQNGSNETNVTVTTTTTMASIVEELSKLARQESTSVWEDYKYAIVAFGFAIVFVICNLLLLFFVKERTGE